MKFKNLPNWLKGGIIGGLIPLIVYLFSIIVNLLFSIDISKGYKIIAYIIFILFFVNHFIMFVFQILISIFGIMISKPFHDFLIELLIMEGSGSATEFPVYMFTKIGVIFHIFIWFIIGVLFGLLVTKGKIQRRTVKILIFLSILLVLLFGIYYFFF